MWRDFFQYSSHPPARTAPDSSSGRGRSVVSYYMYVGACLEFSKCKVSQWLPCTYRRNKDLYYRVSTTVYYCIVTKYQLFSPEIGVVLIIS